MSVRLFCILYACKGNSVNSFALRIVDILAEYGDRTLSIRYLSRETKQTTRCIR